MLVLIQTRMLCTIFDSSNVELVRWMNVVTERLLEILGTLKFKVRGAHKHKWFWVVNNTYRLAIVGCFECQLTS